ncbi:MAG: tetratricopeptide repeat-containing sulfotransferase family protein [Luminiphilus sp.]
MEHLRRQLAHWQAQVAADANNATAWFNLGWWSNKSGLYTQAVKAYEGSIALGISEPEEAMSNLASVYSEHLANTSMAAQWLDRALEIQPDYYQAVFNRAHIAEQTGDRELACQLFARAAKLSPEDPSALARLVDADPTLTETSRVGQQLRDLAGAHVDALIGVSRLQEREGDFVKAWASLTQANETDRLKLPAWSSSQCRHRVISQLETQPLPCTSNLSGDSAPVFILGMLRTGSTLLEQIHAAHAHFHPLGESAFWPREIHALGGGMLKPGRRPSPAQRAEIQTRWEEHLHERGIPTGVRVTDKRPDNLFHIGTILDALPEAKILVTERDWRDTLVSVYGTRLHAQHGYANEPAAIADHIHLCRQIADFWISALPDRVKTVSYEALVDDPHSTLQALFAWLGEQWDPACLDFYKLNNSVRTASVWQVREPLASDRKGRWRLYEEPLRQFFGAALDDPLPPQLPT